MPYIFLVDYRNFQICVENELLGVPDTHRALSQIKAVHHGDQVFIYVYGRKEVYGVFSAKGQVFREQYPARGPWIGRTMDRKHHFYPNRIHMQITEDLPQPLSLDVLERLGIRENRFKGMSVVYITDEEATKLTRELLRRNTGTTSSLRSRSSQFHSTPGLTKASDLGKQEESLQLLIQDNIHLLNESLEVLQPYFNLKDQLGYRGEVDILARSNQDYVVIEVKPGILPKTIWNQVFTYTNVVSNIFDNTVTRAIIICGEVTSRTRFAYHEIKLRLKTPTALRLFQYSKNDTDEPPIQFKEIPWQ